MDFKSFIVVVGIVLVLSYFVFRGANPVNDARAEEIRIQAAQRAQEMELARQTKAQLNAITIDERRARSAQIKAAWATTIKWGGRVLTLGMIVAVLALALSFAQYTTGLSQAKVAQAVLNAKLIPVDPRTGQLPALVDFVEGHLVAMDMNDGSVTVLGPGRAGDAQKIAGMIAVRYAAVIAGHAAKTQTGSLNASVDTPIVQPQLIDMESLTNLLENRSDDNA